MVEKSKSFIPVLVNADAEVELAATYNIGSTPTIVYVAPGGKALVVTLDVVTPEEALADMDAALVALTRPTEEEK